MNKKDIKKMQEKFTNNKIEYCMKCGKPLVKSRRDREGNEDFNYDLRMKIGVCLDCFNKGPEENSRGGGRYRKI